MKSYLLGLFVILAVTNNSQALICKACSNPKDRNDPLCKNIINQECKKADESAGKCFKLKLEILIDEHLHKLIENFSMSKLIKIKIFLTF